MTPLPRPVRRARRALKRARLSSRTRLRDRVRNRRHLGDGPRFLVLRHPFRLADYYDAVLDWLADAVPEARRRFELRTLPCREQDWSRFRLLLWWLSDPMLHELPEVYARARRIEQSCAERGVPVINPVDRVLETAKSRGAAIIASTGIRTPRTVPIADAARFRRDLGGLELPLVIREDFAHGGLAPMHRIAARRELERVPIETYADPIAAEFIDVRSPRDGLCRRYRYLAAGDAGMAVGIHASRDWEVRGEHGEDDRGLAAEELAYVRRQDPNHARLQRARRALGLDFVAFDYSYAADGELVVWEANTLPGLEILPSTRPRAFVPAVLERAYALLVGLCFDRSGLDVPDPIAALRAVSAAEWVDARLARSPAPPRQA